MPYLCCIYTQLRESLYVELKAFHSDFFIWPFFMCAYAHFNVIGRLCIKLLDKPPWAFTYSLATRELPPCATLTIPQAVSCTGSKFTVVVIANKTGLALSYGGPLGPFRMVISVLAISAEWFLISIIDFSFLLITSRFHCQFLVSIPPPPIFPAPRVAIKINAHAHLMKAASWIVWCRSITWFWIYIALYCRTPFLISSAKQLSLRFLHHVHEYKKISRTMQHINVGLASLCCYLKYSYLHIPTILALESVSWSLH